MKEKWNDYINIKVDFRAKNITQDKDHYTVMIKVSINPHYIKF